MLPLLPLLATYCLLIALASLAGGAISVFTRLSHTGMQVAISFVGGVMLGVGILHMLPHSATALGSMSAAASWMLFGFIVMFFLQRFSHFHHHEVSDDRPVSGVEESNATTAPHSASPLAAHHAHCQHDHGSDVHGVHPHSGPRQQASSIGWGAFAIGLALHSVLDGIALAASVQADRSHRLAGLATFLAILLHKPFDSLTITLLMSGRGVPVVRRQWVNMLFTLIVPLGVVLFFLSSFTGSWGEVLTGPVLGFAAGGFLCISASDLLPEVQFHSHDRLPLSASLLAGVFVSWLIELSHTQSWF